MGYSTALMIDQRVSEGIKSPFFNEEAFTTTIPAQLIKKFKTPVVPIFIERFDNIKFKMIVHKPLNFSDNDSIEDITLKLNKILEKMISKILNIGYGHIIDGNKFIFFLISLFFDAST